MEGPGSSPAERADPRLGIVLRDKYRLDRVLGVGGMATVYQATHRNGHRVALKILRAELSVYPDHRRRFVREAYAANLIDHPGALHVLDDDVAEDGCPFLVIFRPMECLSSRYFRSSARGRAIWAYGVLLICGHPSAPGTRPLDQIPPLNLLTANRRAEDLSPRTSVNDERYAAHGPGRGPHSRRFAPISTTRTHAMLDHETRTTILKPPIRA